MKIEFSKMFLFALGCFVTGLVCAVAEKTFYDTVDENGFLHESFFLPLSFLFFAVGMISLVVVFIRKVIRPNFRRSKSRNSTPIGN